MDFEEDGVVSTTAAVAVLLPLHPSLPERGGGGFTLGIRRHCCTSQKEGRCRSGFSGIDPHPCHCLGKNGMALEWGSGVGRWDNQGGVVGGGVGDYLSPLYAQIWF